MRHTHTFDKRQLDDVQRELEDLRLENRIFKSYYERHASEVAAEVDDDKRKTNRQRRRQLPTVLTIEQKVEIGAHEQEVAHKDVSEIMRCPVCMSRSLLMGALNLLEHRPAAIRL